MIIFKQKQKLYYNENTYKITGYITKHHALMICCLVMMIFILYKLTFYCNLQNCLLLFYRKLR